MTKRLSWVWNATPKKVNHVCLLILDDATIDTGTVRCGRFVERFVEEPVKVGFRRLHGVSLLGVRCTDEIDVCNSLFLGLIVLIFSEFKK